VTATNVSVTKPGMCSYLNRRNGGVYYTRMVVPPRLRGIIGKSDLGRSLKTKDQAEAKRLLPAWLEEAQSIIAAARGSSPLTITRLPVFQPIRPLKQKQIGRLRTTPFGHRSRLPSLRVL